MREIELQTGKNRMARTKWCRKYKATTACTVRLCDKLGMKEDRMDMPPKRRVFADSWFASVETASALRNEMELHFTGPIKTATKGFPIDAIRWTLASMNRDHICPRVSGPPLPVGYWLARSTLQVLRDYYQGHYSTWTFCPQKTSKQIR